jgi:hypothetical protein
MAIPQLRINYSPDPINLGFYVTWVESPAGLIYQKEIISVVTKLETVGILSESPLKMFLFPLGLPLTS